MEQHSDRIEGQARSEQSPRVAPRVLGATVVTLAGGTLMVGGQHAQAATFTVDNTNTSGAGSLNQAILDANAAGGADTITITATGTIDVSSGLPDIAESVTIVGPGSGSLTLDGGSGGCDLFEVTTASVDLSISGLTIADVECDAIDMRSPGGSLTLDDVTMTYVYDTFVEVDDLATVTITNSYFNYTYDGDGIYVQRVTGSVTITNTTVNDTDDDGVKVKNSTPAASVTLTDVTTYNTGEDGIDLYGIETVSLTRVSSTENSSDGLEFDSDPNWSDSITIIDSTFSNNRRDGINGDDVVALTVTNVTAESNWEHGLYVEGISTVAIADSTFTRNGENDFSNIVLDGSSSSTGTGSDLFGVSVTITNTTSTYATYSGIVLEDFQSVTIADVTASYSGEYGLLLDKLGTVTITDSTFSYNGDSGIDGDDVVSLTIDNVTASNNSDHGVFVQRIDTVTVTDSTFMYNGDDGIKLDDVYVSLEITDVTASYNDESGVELEDIRGGTVTVTRLSANGNGEDGLYIDQFHEAPAVLGLSTTAVATEITATVVDSSFDGNEYGVRVWLAEATLERVTISDSVTDGVVALGSDVAIVNSTITGSGRHGVYATAEDRNVGFDPDLGEDLFETEGSTVTVSHSTVTGNDGSAVLAGAGIYVSEYVPGEGVQSSLETPAATDVVVSNSIVSGNGDVDVVNLSEDNDAPDQGSTTVTWSLIDEDSDHAGGGNVEADDPMLGALADNGGETLTMLPMSGSPAISAGDPNVSGQPVTDQRGVARVRNRIEIGAVEVDANQGVIEVQTPAAAGEAEGIPVTLVRTGGSDGPVSITLRSSCDGTERTVSWAAGETGPKTVTFPLPNNTTDDPDRVCEIEIVGSTNGDAGVVASFAVTVTDLEDAAVPTLPPTGGSTGPFAALAGALLAMGAAMSRIGRRRPA